MEKNEKLIGLIIFGILTILFATIMILVCVEGYAKKQDLGIQHTLLTIATIGLLISGVFIFKRLEWARKLIIVSYLYYIIDTFIPLSYFIKAVKDLEIPALIVISVGLFLFCAHIYYFMRKDVRMKFTAEKEADVTERDKINYFIKEMKSRHISKYTAYPPLFHLLLKFGFIVKPPYFLSLWVNIFILGFLFCILWGPLYGVSMWFIIWRYLEIPIIRIVSTVFIGSVIAGFLFGFIMAIFYRWKARKLQLPNWKEYPNV